MNTRKHGTTSRFAGLTAFLLAATAVAQGCSNDDNPAPATPVVTGGTSTGGSSSGGSGNKAGKGGSGGDSGNGAVAGDDGTGGTSANRGGSGGSSARGGSGGSGNRGGSGGTNRGGTGNTGNEAGSGDTGNEAGTGNEGGGGTVPNCDPQGDLQCYPCKPVDGNNLQFLNQCNDAKCSHFDNATRIQGYTVPLPSL